MLAPVQFLSENQSNSSNFQTSLEKETFRGSLNDRNAKPEDLRSGIWEGSLEAHRLQRQQESRELKGQHRTGSDQKLGKRFYREKVEARQEIIDWL